jgi:hypothetical protein
VAGVLVSAVDARHSAITDVNGFFGLELRDGTKPGDGVRIHIELEGYRADDVTEAASESVTYPIQISRLPVPSSPSHSLPQASLEFTHTAVVTNHADKSISFVPNDPLEIHVVYANTKSGTASEVYAQCEALIFSGSIGNAGLRDEETKRWNEFTNAWLSNAATDLASDSDIAGHDKSHFCLAQTPPLGQEEAQRLRNQVDVIYILASVKWRDGTGQYESTICSFLLPQEKTPDPKSPIQWRGCVTGHNITRGPFRLPTPASAQPSHIHFNRDRLPGGFDLSACVYCSITNSQTGPVKLGVGPVLLDHDVIQGGVVCAKSGTLLKDMPSDCQDVAVTNNSIDAATAGFENAGKAERVLLSGNTIQPPIGGQAQILRNDPGGEMKDITATNNQLGTSTVPSPPMTQVCAPGANCAMSTGQQGGVTVGQINVGAPPLELKPSLRVIPVNEGKIVFPVEECALKTQITIVPNQVVPPPVEIALEFDNPITKIGATVDGVATMMGGGPFRLGIHALQTVVSPGMSPQHPLIVEVCSALPVKLVALPHLEN